MMKSKTLPFHSFERIIITLANIQQIISTNDIGHYKISWPINGSVNMGFCCEMHYGIWLIAREDRLNRIHVTDIYLLKIISIAMLNLNKGFKIPCIRQSIDVNNFMFRLGNVLPDDRRTDEAGASCYDDSHLSEIKTRILVELGGIEPPTSTLPVLRSPS